MRWDEIGWDEISNRTRTFICSHRDATSRLLSAALRQDCHDYFTREDVETQQYCWNFDVATAELKKHRKPFTHVHTIRILSLSENTIAPLKIHFQKAWPLRYDFFLSPSSFLLLTVWMVRTACSPPYVCDTLRVGTIESGLQLTTHFWQTSGVTDDGTKFKCLSWGTCLRKSDSLLVVWSMIGFDENCHINIGGRHVLWIVSVST